MHTVYSRPWLRAPMPGRLLLCAMAFLLVLNTLLTQRPLALPATATFSPVSIAGAEAMALDTGALALSFVPNAGQNDSQVRFQVHGKDSTLFFMGHEVVLALPASGEMTGGDRLDDLLPAGRRQTPHPAEYTAVRLGFEGANPATAIVGAEQQPGVINYFIGNDPARWRTNVPTYAAIVYQALYPGIDLRYDGAGGRLKGTYTVAPGADPARIRWRYQGAAGARVDETTGDLLIALAGSTEHSLTERAPIAWQTIGGRRVPVSARYAVAADGALSFVLGAYDPAHPLTIDPTLDWSTFLGGSGDDHSFGIAVDPAGNIYMTGKTTSLDFPIVNPLPAPSGANAFVTKLNSRREVVYSTYLGGGNDDQGESVTADARGYATVAGYTFANNFPVTPNAFQADYGGRPCPLAGSPDYPCADGFITQLNASGALDYSTYFGGSRDDAVRSVILDNAGNIVVAGDTSSPNLPGAAQFGSSYQDGNSLCKRGAIEGPCSDAFVARLKIDDAKTTALFSRYLGGDSHDTGLGIASDPANNIYISGWTSSANFPITTGAFQPTYGGGRCVSENQEYNCADAFVTKLNPSGAPIFSTYLGRADDDIGRGITADREGNAYITGTTISADFPTTTTLPESPRGVGYDAFVTKLAPDGRSLVYSLTLGAEGYDGGVAIALDRAERPSIVGETASENFPLVHAISDAFGGGDCANPPDSWPCRDMFVAKLNKHGDQLRFSTYLGGEHDDRASGIATDSMGGVYVTGTTRSPNFPTANAYDDSYNGAGDAFVAKLFVPDWYVAETGDDANDCLSLVTACLTIKGAIDKATAGDVISISPGRYVENLTIDKALSLVGSDTSTTLIDGNQAGPVVIIQPDISVSIANLRISRGQASNSTIPTVGGGIFNDGNLTLSGVAITGNSSDSDGGGIWNNGTLTLIDTSVRSNTAGGAGGGIFHDQGEVTLIRSTISVNTANGTGGGIYQHRDDIRLIQSAIRDNIARYGGGISTNTLTTLTLQDSLVIENIANGSGGGIYNTGLLMLESTVVRANTASAPTVSGGGIFNNGTVTLDHSKVVSNTITGALLDGGGIANNGTLTLRSSHVSGNSVTGNYSNSVRGGGLSNETDQSILTLIDTTVSNNTVTNLGAPPAGTPFTGGGGISSFGSHATLVLTRSHILDNSLSGVDYVWGGGILANGTATLDESTVGGNHMDAAQGSGGGIFGYYNVTMNLADSWVISNTISGTRAAEGGGITALSGRMEMIGSMVGGNRAEAPESHGGGMNINVGSFTLIDSHIDRNYATNAGGITTGGTLSMSGGTIADNRAGNGGGMSNQGTAILSGTQVLNNSAVSRVGGIQNSGTLTLMGASIHGNTAGASEAGILNQPTGSLTIVNSLITHNGAGQGGGGISNYGDTSAIGTVTITGSTIGSNSADSGAGIGNAGRMTIRSSSIISNTADQEAGIFNGQTGELTILDSTVSGNTASIRVGGFFNAGRAWIGNSTISGNSGGLDSGGIRYDGGTTSTLVFTNTTITSNTANMGGGLTVTAGPATLQNTILAGNHATGSPDCAGAIASQGYNLVGDATGCAFATAASDQVGTVTITGTIDPRLGPLADNGGATETHALLPGSPAIDGVASGACPPADQRGVARPYGPFCDIGSFELNTSRDSALPRPEGLLSPENPAGAPDEQQFLSDFNYAATTRLITETQVLNDISALDSLNLQINLDALDFHAALPLTYTDVLTSGLVPNPSAHAYLQIVKTLYDDENLRYYDGVIRSGLCAGMTAAVADFNRPPDDPTGPPPDPRDYGGTQTVSSIPLDPPNDSVQSAREFIQRYQGRQMGSQVLNWMATQGKGTLDPRSLFARIAARIGSEEWRQDPEIIGINKGANCDDFEVGHALLPYAIDVQGDHGLIYVYDPNYPPVPDAQNAEGHVIDIDFRANTWTYQLAKGAQHEVVWTGRTIYGVPLSLFRAPPILPALTGTDIVMVNGGNRFAWGGNRFAWGEVSDTGTRTGCYIPLGGSAAFVRDIDISLRLFPMTGPRILRDGLPIFPETLFFQAGQDMTFTSAGGEVRDLLLFGPHTVMGLLGTASGETRDSIDVDKDFRQMTLHTGQSNAQEQFTLYQMHEKETDNPDVSETRVYAVSNVGIQGNDGLTISVSPTGDSFEVINTGNTPKELDISMAGVGHGGVSSVVFPDLSIGANERRDYEPHDWSDLDSGPMTVTIYDADDGEPKGEEQIDPPDFPNPQSRVLDTFTRPDGPLGQGWRGARGTDNYVLQNNQVRVRDGGPIYWQSQTFGANQEAYVTLSGINPRGEEQGVLLKIQGDVPRYREGAIKVVYDAEDREVRVSTYQPGRGWQHAARFRRLSFRRGDVLGARALSDGRVEVYRNGVRLGIADTRMTNGDFFGARGGRIGLWFDDTRRTTFDTFGGGNIQP